MTATSATRRVGGLRLPAMESLGFWEAPTSTTVPYGPSDAVASTTTSVDDTGLVTYRRGRHSKQSDDLVQELWETTELNAPSLADWSPAPLDRRTLWSRNFRWSRVALAMAVTTLLALGVIWVTQSRGAADQASVSAVESGVSRLSSALDRLPDIGQGGSDTLDLAAMPAPFIDDVDDAARDLFEATSQLPSSEADVRALAVDAAGRALEASDLVRYGVAFEQAVTPVLVAPDLETDPTLIDIEAAALAFTEWRARLETASAALPGGAGDAVTTALADFVSSLDARQSTYVDAIRTKDAAAASTVVEQIDADLEGLDELMASTISSIAADAGGGYDQARDLIGRLLG